LSGCSVRCLSAIHAGNKHSISAEDSGRYSILQGTARAKTRAPARDVQ